MTFDTIVYCLDWFIEKMFNIFDFIFSNKTVLGFFILPIVVGVLFVIIDFIFDFVNEFTNSKKLENYLPYEKYKIKYNRMQKDKNSFFNMRKQLEDERHSHKMEEYNRVEKFSSDIRQSQKEKYYLKNKSNKEKFNNDMWILDRKQQINEDDFNNRMIDYARYEELMEKYKNTEGLKIPKSYKKNTQFDYNSWKEKQDERIEERIRRKHAKILDIQFEDD